MARYCFGMAKIALAAKEASTAGNDTLRKKSALLRDSRKQTRSNWPAFGMSNSTRTPSAEAVIPTIARFRFRVNQKTATNAASVLKPWAMNDFPI